mmetsp:Transcript_11931/g.24691  ORF Transcript_11931/g.24691 Transcript_11931/m.24691 type:complete len:203 (-) Transcript_11931:1739-2347(-)
MVHTRKRNSSPYICYEVNTCTDIIWQLASNHYVTLEVLRHPPVAVASSFASSFGSASSSVALASPVPPGTAFRIEPLASLRPYPSPHHSLAYPYLAQLLVPLAVLLPSWCWGPSHPSLPLAWAPVLGSLAVEAAVVAQTAQEPRRPLPLQTPQLDCRLLCPEPAAAPAAYLLAAVVPVCRWAEQEVEGAYPLEVQEEAAHLE